MGILNLSRVSFDEINKSGVLIVFKKCNFTETRAPKSACLQFLFIAAKIAISVKLNSLPVQLNKNLILICFSIADYYFLIVNVCV